MLPALAGEGRLLLDLRAHRTLHDAAALTRGAGATVRRFRHNDLEHAQRLLRGASRSPRVLCLDGVNSMTGNAPDLPAFAALACEHDALLYVDDAHGFGVLGERSGYDPSPFGRRGRRSATHSVRSADSSFEHKFDILMRSWRRSSVEAKANRYGRGAAPPLP